jgi:hypothetical protein
MFASSLLSFIFLDNLPNITKLPSITKIACPFLILRRIHQSLSKHGNHSRGQIKGLSRDNPGHIFCTGGWSHTALIPIIAELRFIDNVTGVIVQKVKHVKRLFDNILGFIIDRVGQVHIINFSKNLSHLPRGSLIHESKHSLQLEIALNSLMYYMDLHIVILSF